jgi:hypothetical protein
MVRVVPHYFIFCQDTVSPSVFVILHMLTVLTEDLKFSNPFCSISIFGEIRRIETMYSNFRKGPLDLLQILATELHVVDYLKD